MKRSAIAWIVIASVVVSASVQGGTLALVLANDRTSSFAAIGDEADSEVGDNTDSGASDGAGVEYIADDPWEPLYFYDDPDLGPVDSYWVDEFGDLEPRPVHRSTEEHVWHTFTRVATPTFAAKVIVEYIVGDAPDADLWAYVLKNDDTDYWTLAVNLDVAEYPDELVPTLVHEYAHLLSLGRGELDQTTDAAACATISLWEGCLRDTSMMWAFHQRFWADAAGAPAPENDDWELADAYYLGHEDEFVSDYAAMNVVEDFAESFMIFVLEDAPTDSSVASAKINFFAEYPLLVAARERIRAEFGAELGFIP